MSDMAVTTSVPASVLMSSIPAPMEANIVTPDPAALCQKPRSTMQPETTSTGTSSNAESAAPQKPKSVVLSPKRIAVHVAALTGPT